MRKRSKYRPKPVMLDAVGWVVTGVKPVAHADVTLRLLGAKNHSAIIAVREGHATRDDAIFLVNAFNMATALAHMGQGADWLPELTAGQDAIRAASKRPKFLFTGPEMTAVNLAMDIHDAQMSDPKTTIQLLEKAVLGLKKLEAMGKAERIGFENEVTL